ncbi:MAG: flavodoxin family protein [Coriobacteriia bacterium]|nr:flavodoxin family protein [Coriobacteriia bacterium]
MEAIMKVLLLCDRESATGSNLRDAVLSLLTEMGHNVTAITLDHRDLHPCIGCFSCWTRTPGECVVTSDNANSIAKALVCADAVVLLSRITYGGYSADIKSFLDRSIQNIAADFEVYKGEMRHMMRYSRFPLWIAVGYGDASAAEQRTFACMVQRNALNVRPKDYLVLTIQDRGELEEAAQPILRLLGAGA